ncbi:MAG TPA: peptide chain release factor N(5)-glutamine methyltransferase [Chitinophagaceae bacterium]|nr:peptide chain release factor N(5)-glutamine methyltransferase [Chitinophagaceae bacterium]
MTIFQAYQQLVIRLTEIYDNSEAANIADLVMEHITGCNRIDRIVNKDFSLSVQKEERLKEITTQLLAHRPVQYVLGEAWFAGMKFYVNEKVLIPRPETEELMEWIVSDHRLSVGNTNLRILDIGTGSGCIPVALKKKLPNAEVTAIDVCTEALHIAIQNAGINEVEIDFRILDFLNKSNWNGLGQFNVIVSNPPYVKKSEAKEMRKSVLDYEPSLALFVPDNDALIFYRYIAEFAKLHLRDGGSVYLEINESLGLEVANLLTEKGFSHIELKKDMQGKERMIKAGFN